MQRGLITYTATKAQTPYQAPLTSLDPLGRADTFLDVVAIGDQQDIYLYWGYKSLDPLHTDNRSLSRSASGVVEVIDFGSSQGFKFSCEFVNEVRATGMANEYAMMNALNDELASGTPISWYPDIDAFPDEYYSCVAVKRTNPTRSNSLMRWKFDFELMVVAAVQIPSTAPAFAA